jgi:6 kDa early secretory antigenic target
MSFDALRVDHRGLDTAAADLLATVRAIDSRLAHLDGELVPLRHEWGGQAQLAYAAAKAKWDEAMREMRSVLDETGRAVAQSNADYRAADQRGAAFGG